MLACIHIPIYCVHACMCMCRSEVSLRCCSCFKIRFFTATHGLENEPRQSGHQSPRNPSTCLHLFISEMTSLCSQS